MSELYLDNEVSKLTFSKCVIIFFLLHSKILTIFFLFYHKLLNYTQKMIWPLIEN